MRTALREFRSPDLTDNVRNPTEISAPRKIEPGNGKLWASVASVSSFHAARDPGDGVFEL